MKTVTSRNLLSDEWNEMQTWLKLHTESIGYKEITWIMDSDQLCFRVCVTLDNAEIATLFWLAWS